MKSEAEPIKSLTCVLYRLYELEAQIVQWLEHLPNFNRLPDRKRAIEYDEELTIYVAIFHHVLILARALKTKLGHYKGELRWLELELLEEASVAYVLHEHVQVSGCPL